MRKKFTLLIALVIALLLPFTVDAKGFSDTEDHWAEEFIRYCAEKGYIAGYPDGSFKPNQSITKAEYYSITNQMNASRIKDVEKTPVNFTDVKEGEWAYGQVQKGLSLGYIEKNIEELRPFEAITREDAVRIFSFNKGWKENASALNIFKDKDQVTERFRGLVGAAVENKVLAGYPDGNFGPKDPLTRAEVVTLIAVSEGFRPESMIKPNEDGKDPLVGLWVVPQKIKFNNTEELTAALIISSDTPGRYQVEEIYQFSDETGWATLSYAHFNAKTNVFKKDASFAAQVNTKIFGEKLPGSGEIRFLYENDTLRNPEGGITYVKEK